jgi:hypothetical protein
MPYPIKHDYFVQIHSFAMVFDVHLLTSNSPAIEITETSIDVRLCRLPPPPRLFNLPSPAVRCPAVSPAPSGFRFQKFGLPKFYRELLNPFSFFWFPPTETTRWCLLLNLLICRSAKWRKRRRSVVLWNVCGIELRRYQRLVWPQHRHRYLYM